MRTTVLNSKVVVMYDSISDLPIDRYHAFNKMVLIDSGIGSDLSDFDNHFERLRIYINTNPDEAIKELNNLRQSVFFIQNDISPKLLAFAALVVKINGKDYSDLSADGLKKVVEEINGEAFEKVTGELEEVKKK